LSVFTAVELANTFNKLEEIHKHHVLRLQPNLYAQRKPKLLGVPESLLGDLRKRNSLWKKETLFYRASDGGSVPEVCRVCVFLCDWYCL